MVVGGPCLARLGPGRRVKGVARPAPAQRTAGSFPLPAYALQGGALRLAGCILVRRRG